MIKQELDLIVAKSHLSKRNQLKITWNKQIITNQKKVDKVYLKNKVSIKTRFKMLMDFFTLLANQIFNHDYVRTL